MRAWSEAVEQVGAVGPAAAVGTRSVRKLSELKAGESCTVVRFERGAVDHVRRLVALGVMPGARLSVSQKWPSVVFRMGFSEFAVDAGLAAAIVVEVR